MEPQSPDEGSNSDHTSSSSEYSDDDNCSDDSRGSISEDNHNLPMTPVPSTSNPNPNLKPKIRVQSSLQIALQRKKAPLLAYFKQCTWQEYEENLARKSEKQVNGDHEKLERMEKQAAQRRIREK
jgi:hypothetical protein